jgi:hypothetical protein
MCFNHVKIKGIAYFSLINLEQNFLDLTRITHNNNFK